MDMKNTMMRIRPCVWAVVLMLVLFAAVFGGCSGEKEQEQADLSTIYWNLNKGAERTCDADGFAAVDVVTAAGEVKQLQVAQDVLPYMDQLDLFGVQTDESGKVTGLVRLSDLPVMRLAWDYYVMELKENEAILRSTMGETGKEVTFIPTEKTKILDLTECAQVLGGETELVGGDCITVLADMTGSPLTVFVSQGATRYTQVSGHCEHCDSEVQWYQWSSENTLPLYDGHYKLMNDVNVTAATKIVKMDVCLDLNGMTVTQTKTGQRIYQMSSGTLSILDSAGNGTIIPATTGRDQPSRWGMIVEMSNELCTLNLYSGTMDASKCYAQYGNAVNQVEGTFNMYGGTILGGTAYGTGSSAIRAGGIFNMYGGKIVGGYSENSGYINENIPGGGTMRIAGTTTIYDGEIICGKSDYNGGGLYVEGTLNMLGGSITGGESAGVGGGIYVIPGGTAQFAGDAKVTDNVGSNVYVCPGAMAYIGSDGLTTGEDGAKIGLTLEDPAASYLTSSADAKAFIDCLFSDNEDYSIVVDDYGDIVVRAK